jgi:hypothetical protein
MEYKYEIKSALLVILFTIITFSAVRAQEDASDIAAAMAEIMALTDDHEASLLLEHLSDLREKPVTINSGDKNEIARLFFLTEFQVMVLVDHIKRNGTVVSLYCHAYGSVHNTATTRRQQPGVCRSHHGADDSRITSHNG